MPVMTYAQETVRPGPFGSLPFPPWRTMRFVLFAPGY